MRYAISEILEIVNETRGKNKRIGKLLEFSNPQLKTVLDMAFNPHIKFLLPNKPYIYPENLDSETVARTRLYAAAQKLIIYTNIGPYPDMDGAKRENLFLTLLESLHTNDAKLVEHIVRFKGTPYEKIDADLVKAAFPILTKNW